MRSHYFHALMLSALVVGCDETKDPLSVTSGAATRLIALDGDGQVGVMGEATTIAPTVLVLDANNLPVGGTQVNFVIQSGGGALSRAQATSGANGEASVTWTLGPGFGGKVLEASSGSLKPVTFKATAVAPDSGISSFVRTDPLGDTLSWGELGLPLAPDLLSMASEFKRDSIIFTMTFSRPVTPASQYLASALGGAIEIDIDDNPNTGEESVSNYFGASANVGVDFGISMFDATSTTALLFALQNPTDVQTFEVPATFSGTVVTVRIPMSLLDDDDGNYTAVSIFGTPDRPTDIAPNSGGIVARTGPALGTGSVPSLAERATDLLRPKPSWGKALFAAPRG